MTDQSAANQSYETLFARLQEVVARLEQGDLPLAEALTAYEEGMRLTAACQQMLDAAELRIQELRADTGLDASDWED